MPAASSALRAKWETAAAERSDFLSKVNQRIVSGGDPMSAEERTYIEELNSKIEQYRADYEAQRDLEGLVAGADEYQEALQDVGRVSEAAGELKEGVSRAVRDIGGATALEAHHQRAGEQLDTFSRMSADGKAANLKLRVNAQAARNFRALQSMGVDPKEYVRAVQAGRHMVAERNAEGERDVRLYQVGSDTNIIPTYWDDTLYLWASYIGGVESCGPDIIPLLGNNSLNLPKLDEYHTPGLSSAKEGETVTDQVQDTVTKVTVNPRPYRGFSAETDELMRAAVIDVRMMLVLRGLARALQLGKETEFHNGTGAANGQCLGILNSAAATAARTSTIPKNKNIPYSGIPNALGMLDPEYHMGMRPGAISTLMHSAQWFGGFVAATGSDGHPIFPNLATNVGPPNLFNTNIVYSFLLSNKVGSDVPASTIMAVVGNFLDAYVIATLGGSEIEVSDDVRFLDWERVYRIQEYCDGTVRDNRALSYITTGT